MSRESFGSSNFRTLPLLLVLFPIFIGSVKILGNLIFVAFFIHGVYTAISKKLSPFSQPQLRLFSWLTTGYFLLMFFSICISENADSSFLHLARLVHFLAAPFVALSFTQFEWELDQPLVGFKLGLILMSCIIFIQYFSGISRPSGMYNSNVLGDLFAIMVVTALIKIWQEKAGALVLSSLAFGMGALALYLMEVRGSLLSFGILLMVVMVANMRFYLRSTISRMILLMVFLIFLLLGLNSPNVKSRIIESKHRFEQWQVGENLVTGVGVRLEMYMASIEAIKNSPWIGYGYRNEIKAVINFIREEAKAEISTYTHLHNQYITNFVSAGIFGFLWALALVLVPLWQFAPKLGDRDLGDYAMMGMLLCVGYATFGLTHIAFGEEHMNAFFIIFLAMLLPLMHGETSQHNSKLVSGIQS